MWRSVRCIQDTIAKLGMEEKGLSIVELFLKVDICKLVRVKPICVGHGNVVICKRACLADNARVSMGHKTPGFR